MNHDSDRQNPLFYLVSADLEEKRQNNVKVEEYLKQALERCTLINEITLVYIHYMRFMRRTQGLEAARKIFKMAREDTRGTTYHVYIAAANMEYFCTKDKQVAFKIYQLGAKKFPNLIEYMLLFIKFMYNMNEDNNTRVLFERILTSNDLPKDRLHEIWTEFLKFECAVGDLASILKVDKKRQKAIEELKESEKFKGTLMIDRYKFLDLLPCSLNELKSLGYKDDEPVQVSASSKKAFDLNVLNEARRRIKFAEPDEMQMLPFKPMRNALPGQHPVAGGIFPFPPAVEYLVKKLPPPSQFLGPFVIVDELIRRFPTIELRDDFTANYVNLNGEQIREQDGSLVMKRAQIQSHHHHHESDDDDSKKTRVMDIYKQRQHMKLATNKS